LGEWRVRTPDSRYAFGQRGENLYPPVAKQRRASPSIKLKKMVEKDVPT